MSDAGKPEGDNYLLKVDNPLVVPVDRKIRIVTTADDVIHAWMVPAFGVKQDAIPGFVRDTWFRAEKTGDFYGQCAELCGKEHAYMPIHVKVLSQQDDYTKWVDGKKKEDGCRRRRPDQGVEARGAGARGEKVYAANCAACHRPTARAPARSRRWTARPSCWTPTRPSRSPSCSTAPTTARCRPGSSCPTPSWRPSSPTPRTAGATRPGSWCSRPSGRRPQVIAVARQGTEMSAVLDHHGDHAHDDHDHGHPHGWRRWVFATNHKDIGTMYLLFSFTMLMVGGMLALGIRAELFQPGLQFVNPELFNQFTTMHGLIMVFGAIMPAFVGFANWMIPLQIGAADMAFARMNNLSFWLLIPAAIMLVASFFMPGGAPAAAGRCTRR
jgi:mono/diheme cytochrome c family protein